MPIWKMKRRSILTKRPFRKIKRRFAMMKLRFTEGLRKLWLCIRGCIRHCKCEWLGLLLLGGRLSGCIY